MSTLSISALVLIFLGGVGAILLTIAQSVESAKDKQEMIDLTKNENRVLKDQLNELQRERDSLKNDLEKRDERIQTQTSEIIGLNQRLVEKSDYISDHITGGKGYPFIFCSSIKAKDPRNDEKITFTITNENHLPLYDVVAVVYDWNYIESKTVSSANPNIPLLSQDDLAKSVLYRFDEAQITANSSSISKQKFDLRDGLLYIQLKSRSSFVFEKIASALEGNKIYQGFIVYDENGQTLKEWMSPNITESAKAAIIVKFNKIPKKVTFNLSD